MRLDVDYERGIERFCQRVEDAFQPDCIILHGSVARGTNTPYSDIDLLVIGEQLSEDFFERAFELNRLRDGTIPIEVLGYTRSEWAQMMEQRHLTVLEALHWGQSLRGHDCFALWQKRLDTWKAHRLYRSEGSWVLPVG